MGSMQWQLGREMGTIPAFASRTQENHEDDDNYCCVYSVEILLMMDSGPVRNMYSTL